MVSDSLKEGKYSDDDWTIIGFDTGSVDRTPSGEVKSVWSIGIESMEESDDSDNKSGNVWVSKDWCGDVVGWGELTDKVALWQIFQLAFVCRRFEKFDALDRSSWKNFFGEMICPQLFKFPWIFYFSNGSN